MAIRLAVLLRLAVRLNRARTDQPLLPARVEASDETLTLVFPAGWEEAHPLSAADLAKEAGRVRALGIRLDIEELEG